MLESVMHAVGDRAIVVERGEDFLDLVQHVVDADDIEEGFLLARERSIRKILGGRRRAHRDGDVGRARVLAQFRVRLADRLVEIGRQRGVDDPAADLLAGSGQRIDVLDVERRQPILDPFGQTALLEIVLKRLRSRREAARHRNAELGEVADHLAERGVLAADPAEIGHAQRIEPKHQIAQGNLRKIAGACGAGPQERVIFGVYAGRDKLAQGARRTRAMRFP